MTYTVVAAPFVLIAAALLVLGALRHRPDGRWWWATGGTLLLLVVLTVVFDNVMIAVDLYRFDDDQISGLRIGLVPVEDLAWPVAAGLGLPGAWLLLGEAER